MRVSLPYSAFPVSCLAFAFLVSALPASAQAAFPDSGCGGLLAPLHAASGPVSVVFLLDNSGSMDETDPGLYRFSIVRSVLDSLAAFAPGSEAALIPFTRRLSFDVRDNPFFQTLFPGDTVQFDSFVPFTALAKAFPDGATGLDTLKALLQSDPQGDLTHATKLPAARINSGMGRGNIRDGTDLTLAFDAARLALRDARSAEAAQFVILLSDGLPSSVDNGREGLMNQYVAGTGLPATLALWFNSGTANPLPPDPIAQMIANIGANGYSVSNPLSRIYLAYGEANRPCMDGLPVRPRAKVSPNPISESADLFDATGRILGKNRVFTGGKGPGKQGTGSARLPRFFRNMGPPAGT
jgi:hypothetical protein